MSIAFVRGSHVRTARRCVQTLVACIVAHAQGAALVAHARALLPQLLLSYRGTMAAGERACLQLMRRLDDVITAAGGTSFLQHAGGLWGALLAATLEGSTNVDALLTNPELLEPRCVHTPQRDEFSNLRDASSRSGHRDSCRTGQAKRRLAHTPTVLVGEWRWQRCAFQKLARLRSPRQIPFSRAPAPPGMPRQRMRLPHTTRRSLCHARSSCYAAASSAHAPPLRLDGYRYSCGA